MEIHVVYHPLHFKRPARTSRDVLVRKPSWFLCAKDALGQWGIGECSLIPGLSPESESDAVRALEAIAHDGILDPELVSGAFPAVRFAVEMAALDLRHGGKRVVVPSPFCSESKPLPINGLIWMDEPEVMLQQAKDLIERGFHTLKIKVGTMPFDAEWAWLKALRTMAPESEGYVLRLDANGAFSRDEVGWTPLQKLERLSQLGFHSIEQPLVPSDRLGLAEMCAKSPIPIALDESLIGVYGHEQEKLLQELQPAYLVLKPSLLGGLDRSESWIRKSAEQGVGWWATSALESNIGLNAIAQWSSSHFMDNALPLPQGLGTGSLYTNNIESPLDVKEGAISLDPHGTWNLQYLMDQGI